MFSVLRGNVGGQGSGLGGGCLEGGGAPGAGWVCLGGER